MKLGARVDKEGLEVYTNKFEYLFKKAMQGLLEPYGDLATVLGEFKLKELRRNLCDAFRELLEASIPVHEVYFGDEYPTEDMQAAIDRST